MPAAVSAWGRLRGVLAAAREFPLFRQLREAAYERRFEGDLLGAFRGVYATFDEALASAPMAKPTGFDLNEIGEFDFLRSRVGRIFSYDYPVLYWLQRLLLPGMTVFDFGGHVGVHFYGYQKYLDNPADLRWMVCELPSIASAGEVMAAGRSGPRPIFTTDRGAADGAHVFIAAGALQYVESPSLAEALAGLARPPNHLLLNKLPLTDGDGFVTLQNGGPHFIALHVFNRTRFIESIQALGYELVDSWEDRMHRCEIPFRPELTVPWFSGLYFRRAD